jgi:hypothetical protein
MEAVKHQQIQDEEISRPLKWSTARIFAFLAFLTALMIGVLQAVI